MENINNRMCPDIEGKDILPEPRKSKLLRVAEKLTRFASIYPSEAPDYMSNHYRGEVVQEDEVN